VFPFGVTATVYSTARDRHGDRTREPVGTIDGCGLAPESSTEDNDKRAQTVMTTALYVPPTTVTVDSQSEIEVDGHLWQITGDPQWWRNPFTGWSPGGVLHLQRVREGTTEGT
jgi:hypothetical protein